jgi:polar amino acid transport system substrate-binding protein
MVSGLFRILPTVFAILLAMPACGDDRLVIATEENPPFNVGVGGRVAGTATAVLRAALADAGIDYSMALYPWARAYYMALRGKNNCVFSTARIDQREAKFLWIGPLARDRWYILAAAGFDHEIAGIEDLRHYHVAALNGSAVALYLKGNGVDVMEVTEDQLIARMLQARRIDLWATSERGFYFAAADKRLRVKSVLKLRDVDLYLACNLDTDPSLVERLNAALAARAGKAAPALSAISATPSSMKETASSKTDGQPGTWTGPSTVR